MPNNKRWMDWGKNDRAARINRMFPRWQRAMPLGDRSVIQPAAPNDEDTRTGREGSSR